jgi:hypothetical protein
MLTGEKAFFKNFAGGTNDRLPMTNDRLPFTNDHLPARWAVTISAGHRGLNIEPFWLWTMDDGPWTVIQKIVDRRPGTKKLYPVKPVDQIP